MGQEIIHTETSWNSNKNDTSINTNEWEVCTITYVPEKILFLLFEGSPILNSP